MPIRIGNFDGKLWWVKGFFKENMSPHTTQFAAMQSQEDSIHRTGAESTGLNLNRVFAQPSPPPFFQV
jgi:hypothetical protein